MPKQVATVLFVAFIAYLLRRASKCGPAQSWGVWVPTIWIGIMISKPVTYWFQSGSAVDFDTALEGSPIERTVLTALIVAAIVVLMNRRPNWSALFSGYQWIIWVFYGYCLLSIIWSPFPFVSFKRLIREVGTIVMILIVLTEADRVEALKRLFIRCAVVLIPLSVMYIKYYPLIGRYTHRWTYKTMYSGITTNKNSLGLLAMISGLFLLWHIFESRNGRTVIRQLASVWPEATVLGMCFWILNLANSQTAVVCFVLGAVTLISCRTVLAGLSVKVTASAIVLVAVLGGISLTTPIFRGVVAESVGRDESFTERTDIWKGCLALPINRVVGAGFSSTWLTPAGWAFKQD